MGLKQIEADVLVVGSGVAGVMAASKAAHMGCRVVLASKVSMKSGNSALAGGGWLVPSADFPPDEYVRLVTETGKKINDTKLVRVLAERAESMMRELIEMGVPLERRGRTHWFVDVGTSRRVPGIILMDALLKHVEDERITPLPWFSVIELLLDGGRASGALGISRSEDLVIIDAKSVVLATGGGGGLYRRHDNHRRIVGDGYWLALRAGLPLRDMEFVQCYPLGLAEPQRAPAIIYPPYPKEAKAIDSQGQDLIKKHGLTFDLNESIVGYRDQFTLVLSRELERGKVYLDYTGVPEKEWERPALSRLVRINPDFRSRPFSVAPIVHFFMGGVEIDVRAQTAIPGLFAAGEATSGVHGANRAGGNALTECAVFGEVAGESAARYVMESRRGRSKRKVVDVKLPWKYRAGKARKLFHEVQALTWTHAGPIRNAESLQEGLSRVSEMEGRVAELEAAGNSLELNEVKGGLLMSKAIMRTSLEREESRGAFYREDFPERDDRNWLKNIILTLDGETGDFIVSHRPIDVL
jgi:succinate dehydrogenase/fumarate reductase flavoprotein subunit